MFRLIDYCDNQQYELEDRLELYIKLCELFEPEFERELYSLSQRVGREYVGDDCQFFNIDIMIER